MSTEKVIIVIQARSGSSRLPGKVFLDLAGKPLLVRMAERVSASDSAGKYVIATTTDKSDDKIEILCRNEGLECYRGHPTDLLERHYMASKQYGADHVVKIPSDCPLIDPSVIRKVIGFYLENESRYDFVSNLHPPSYPDGNDVEIMPFHILETAYKNAVKPLEREHTTPYIWDNPGIFRIGNYEWEKGLDYSMSHRFTVDYEEDYEFIKRVYNELHSEGEIFSLEDILDLLERKPDIKKINEKYAGVNWYRNHLKDLKTVSKEQTRQINDKD